MLATEQTRYTPMELAEMWGVRSYVLNYAINKARINPAARVGMIRLFAAEQVPRIKAALDSTRRPNRQENTAVA